MIREVIITTCAAGNAAHIAPMGVHVEDEWLIVQPFKPSTTLDNLLASGCAAVNYTDDVRIFAGCVTGRRDWPLLACSRIAGHRLAGALAHAELELVQVEPNELRPRLRCRVRYEANHAPFRGFNRAQMAVLEAAILVSRLHLLPWEKVEQELAYLTIGWEKTAGTREREAWGWLLAAIEQFRAAALHRRST